MDYSIVINGSVDDEAEEESVMSEACEMVAELEGVSSATWNSPSFANVDMRETDGDEVNE